MDPNVLEALITKTRFIFRKHDLAARGALLPTGGIWARTGVLDAIGISLDMAWA